MHIGLIGGIGVAATVVYYQRLTRACERAPELTIVHADAQDLVRNFADDSRAAQARVYARLIDRLKAAGADCAAITSLGGHFCYDETAALSALPLVSGVAPLDDYFGAQGLTTVGLLGTGMVMRTGLFGQLVQTGTVAPDDTRRVGQAYQDIALAGSCDDATAAMFHDEGRQLILKGAEAVVLAGTDLNLAFEGRDPGYRVIDALDVHVALLADIAMDRRQP